MRAIINYASGGSGGGYDLSVTCDSSMAGQTITCTDGTTTLTETCPSSSPYLVIFSLSSKGTYTVSGGGVSKQVSVDGFNTSLVDVPDGSTVTPVNDIQTWLHCGEIFDKSYTTISQILSDQVTLTSLLTNYNSVDYLARSTSWVSDVCADQYAVRSIGDATYCSHTLLNQADWLAGINGSADFESVLTKKIPIMTSDNTPSGESYANSTFNQNMAAWKAFNGVAGSTNDNNRWAGYDNLSGLDAYLEYKFEAPVEVHRLELLCVVQGSVEKAAASGYVFQGSNDETNWTNVYSTSMTEAEVQARQTYSFVNATAYRYYRIYFTSSNQGKWVQVRILQLYGR